MSSPRFAIALPPARVALDLDRLLHSSLQARGFAPRAVPFDLIAELLALMACGPGMADAAATRLLVLTSSEAKARLAAGLPDVEREAVLRAPACVLIAHDRDFAEQMLTLASDGLDGRSNFAGPARLQAAVLRSSVLQGAYLTVSARALGLEVDFFPTFDAGRVRSEFFDEPGLEAIFVAAMGYPADRPR
jgi:3-hydroxypropanoate dehydrogenase